MTMAEGDIGDCTVFPPRNHEGLHLQSQNQQDSTPSPSLPSSLPSHLDVRGTTLGLGSARWFIFGLHLLHSKLLAVASSFRHYAKTRLKLWPFGPATGFITALVLAFLYLMLRLRRRRSPHPWERSLDQMILLIKERDEKIIQLLCQIIQMNETLLARHRVGEVASD